MLRAITSMSSSVDHIGIEVVEPDPVEVQLTQLAQQLGQHGLLIKIHAVTGDILRNDNEFLHPSVGQSFFASASRDSMLRLR